jgi:hypothetical protein
LQSDYPNATGYLPVLDSKSQSADDDVDAADDGFVDGRKGSRTDRLKRRGARRFKLMPGELEHLEREFEAVHGAIDRSTAAFDPDALLSSGDVRDRVKVRPKPICQRCYSLRHYGRLLSVDVPLNATVVVSA